MPYFATTRIKKQILTTYQFNQIDQAVVINNMGLYWKSTSTELNYKWIQFHKVTEQKEAFCFYVNYLEYRVIPKRILEANQITLLRNILKTNISSKYRTQGIKEKKKSKKKTTASKKRKKKAYTI